MRARTLFFALIGLVIVGGVAYFMVRREPLTAPAAFDLAATSTSSSLPAVQIPSGSVSYQNAAYRFSLYYPQELTVQSYDEGGGATTLTFQNASEAEGFQIFIVPYSGSEVSETRFDEDEPSHVRTDARAATVGGASGAAFYSTSVSLGDTYEVWFIHGGYLYEVTTFKSLEDWLNGILATWRF